jgi:hypothetical protein
VTDALADHLREHGVRRLPTSVMPVLPDRVEAVRWIDPPIPADRQLWDALAGKTDAIRLLYEAFIGPGSGDGLGWMPMLSEIVRKTGERGHSPVR